MRKLQPYLEWSVEWLSWCLVLGVLVTGILSLGAELLPESRAKRWCREWTNVYALVTCIYLVGLGVATVLREVNAAFGGVGAAAGAAAAPTLPQYDLYGYREGRIYPDGSIEIGDATKEPKRKR